MCNETGNEYTRPQTKGLETHPNELEIKPMSAPIGLLFYIDFQYQSNDDEAK